MTKTRHPQSSLLIGTGISRLAHRLGIRSFLLAISITLVACGGGEKSERNPEVTNDESILPTGALRNSDVESFKANFWAELRTTDRCGDCHRPGANNPVSPFFVDWENINDAYDAMVNGGYVNLSSPASSSVVDRVRKGHGCWSKPDNNACADAMIAYITNWANGFQKGEASREVTLAPIPDEQLRDPGAKLLFPPPPTIPTAYDGVHSLLTQYCSDCHVSTSNQAQSPFFAVDDVASSYNAAKIKIDLNNPANSDFVKRLALGHSCWDDCTSNANTMQTAIEALAVDIDTNYNVQLDSSRIIMSKALTLLEGIQSSGGNRFESNQIALYEFKTRKGYKVLDTSGVEPGLNLTLYGVEGRDYRWLNNWGIEFITPQSRAQGKTADSKKLHDLLKLSGQYTIEAWLIPGNVTQMDSNIVSYSNSGTDRNFTLGQNMYNYEFAHRSSNTDTNGAPMVATPDEDELVQASLQHVVVTYDMTSGRKIYVNGQLTGAAENTKPGDMLNWHSSYALIFGNEANSSRPWSGILRMVAIHDRALTPEQININYTAEVGQKYLMPFHVSSTDIPGIPDDSYIVFKVSQYDEFSYLFSDARYVNLGGNTPAAGTTLRGMRIGLNGDEVPVGQPYTNLDVDLTDGFSLENGVELTGLHAIIELQNGADIDEFFLTFEHLGARDRTLAYDENDADLLTDIPPLPTREELDKSPDIGVRTFEEINATMARMTGLINWENIPQISNRAEDQDGVIIGIYPRYKQQLPSVENIETFLPSHQMAIAQLALTYCSVLVDTNVAFFTDPLTSTPFNFDVIASSAFGNTAPVINPLLVSMLNADLNEINNDLLSQPATAEVRQEIEWLINGDGGSRAGLTGAACMTANPSCDDRDRTRHIVKAACAAVLSSATMLVQ